MRHTLGPRTVLKTDAGVYRVYAGSEYIAKFDSFLGGKRNAEKNRANALLDCAAPIGAELAEAVLACFGFVTADGPTRVGATNEEVLALVALAHDFQKQGGG